VVATRLTGALARAGLEGPVVEPGHADYERLRRVYNEVIERRPGAIVRAATAADVQKVVALAAETGLPLAIRCGGHSFAGLGTCDDGIVCDLSRLNRVVVDPVARTVEVGGGALLGDVDAAGQPFGLVTPAGVVSHTGVGGLTLGGGMGWLSRRFGLTIDNLLEAEIVTADGRRSRVAADEDPELFWAIRGGGGNFGVVTSFLFRLHEVGTIFGGPTFWSVEDGAEVLSAYREFITAAPRELNGFFAFHTVPPGPPFPEEIHLRKVSGVVWCYVGSEQDAAKAMAPFLASVPEPLMHGVGPMPHAALQGAFDGLYPAGEQWYWRADFVKEIPDEAVKLHAKFGAEMPTMKSTMHMYPIDGAAHDVAAGDTAWSYRDANWGSVFAGVDPDPENVDAISRWSIDYHEALHPYSAGGAYVNMMMNEGQERVRAAYRGNYGRLASVKATYDPDNIFRVNQNIEPS
jgi:FAD/FMN-containing dehydrogenase